MNAQSLLEELLSLREQDVDLSRLDVVVPYWVYNSEGCCEEWERNPETTNYLPERNELELR